MTNVKQISYKHHPETHIIRKSYGVMLSPENKLCNSVPVLTAVI
ncbi:hypothetical protein ACSDIA_002288 [Cronobacter turicensis]|uniref:Uncharacterized protein n=1 Tax=Cronobacter turicensis TaxID=413502 RepID=A0ACD5IZK7_9ENTR